MIMYKHSSHYIISFTVFYIVPASLSVSREEGEEAGGKPGGRIRSALMFSGRGGRGGERHGSCQGTARHKHSAPSVGETIHPSPLPLCLINLAKTFQITVMYTDIGVD